MYPHALRSLLNEPENNCVTVVTLLKTVKDNRVSKKCQIKARLCSSTKVIPWKYLVFYTCVRLQGGLKFSDLYSLINYDRQVHSI